ncbi:MAG TPA: SH3 domain-containing protein, partial [Aggregatilineales bacterium]|nr:SH3 domain-containing protein [Aggregatilineales bacterium]
LGQMSNGVTFPITGSVADGQSIEGNRLWYQIEYEGQVGYVSATLVGLVSAQPVSAPVNQSIAPVSTVAPISVAPSTQWDCSGDRYNCDSAEFNSCSVIWGYFNACP